MPRTKNLEATKETKAPKEPKAPKEAVIESKIERPKTKIELMKEALAKQPKRSIMIPLEPNEKKGLAFETVQLNGYTYQLMKGVYVEVPEQIAQIIMDSQKQTMEALEAAQRQVPNADRLELDNSN
ncbi:MAG: hypothetical protein HY959_03735 [Ignavibacteriae bacterium]|nr:hypothetical protein [Ignavibacteriota bacterium]